MKIALISDIHSNYIALDAVLADLKKRKEIEKIVCLGDLVGYAPYPDKIFPLINDSKIQTILGNYDEAVAFDKESCGCGYSDKTYEFMGKISLEWTVGHTSQENKGWMKSLPRKVSLEVNGKKVLMVHGSPESINGRIEPDLSEEELYAVMENANADILLCGHTHWPFHMIIKEKHIINPGSVGRPRIGSPQANYALVDIQKRCDVRFRFVDYDYESFAKEIETSQMPKNNFAEVIRTGYWKF
jgi:putative phosphoesterase